MSENPQVAAYPITPEFERAIVALVCRNPQFYGIIGHEVEVAGLPSDAARLAFDAANAIAKDLGSGPDSQIAVMQRLRRWREEGKVTHEEILAVGDMLDAADDAGVPSVTTAVNELRPILQKRMRYAAVREAMQDYGQQGDLAKAAEMIAHADAIGRNDISPGVKYGEGVVDLINQLKGVDKLKYYMGHLDREIGGGLFRGQLGVFMGGPGDGKSMALSHVTARQMQKGLLCLYATLEVPTTTVYARIMANLYGLSIDDIERDPDQLRPLIASKPNYCPCFVKDFTPKSTTVEDLKAWVAQIENQMERPVDVLLVDYADKLGAKARKRGAREEEKGMYETMLDVYEGLRVYAHSKQFWVLTASQSTGRQQKKDKEILDIADVADSIHKARVADQIITLNRRSDGDEMIFYIAKNRTGPSGKRCDPVPCNMARGQVAPVVLDDSTDGNFDVPMGAPALADGVKETLFNWES